MHKLVKANQSAGSKYQTPCMHREYLQHSNKLTYVLRYPLVPMTGYFSVCKTFLIFKFSYINAFKTNWKASIVQTSSFYMKAGY